MALDGAAGHSHEAADLAVSQFQDTMQNQNALLLLRQTGESLGHKLVVNQQIISMRRKNIAVAGGNDLPWRACPFPAVSRRPAAFHGRAAVPIHADSLWPRCGVPLYKSVIAVPQEKLIAGDSFHLLTPFLWGI